VLEKNCLMAYFVFMEEPMETPGLNLNEWVPQDITALKGENLKADELVNEGWVVQKEFIYQGGVTVRLIEPPAGLFVQIKKGGTTQSMTLLQEGQSLPRKMYDNLQKVMPTQKFKEFGFSVLPSQGSIPIKSPK